MGYTCRSGRANREARAPFTHRRMADPAKTAKKRTALLPRIVQKTSRYPMAENHAQSTRKSLVRPSTMKQATMTITATEMALLGISTPLWVRRPHGPVTGSHLGWRRAERGGS